MPLFSHPFWGQQSGQSSVRCQPPCAPLGNLGPPRARRVVGSVQSLALSWGCFRHREATGNLGPWPSRRPGLRPSDELMACCLWGASGVTTQGSNQPEPRNLLGKV